MCVRHKGVSAVKNKRFGMEILRAKNTAIADREQNDRGAMVRRDIL